MHLFVFGNTICKPRQNNIAFNFSTKGNFIYCCVDGKLANKKTNLKKQCVSPYYYYKEYCLIMILLALVDADYGFIQANVGGNGPASDAGIYKSDYYM